MLLVKLIDKDNNILTFKDFNKAMDYAKKFTKKYKEKLTIKLVNNNRREQYGKRSD